MHRMKKLLASLLIAAMLSTPMAATGETANDEWIVSSAEDNVAELDAFELSDGIEVEIDPEEVSELSEAAAAPTEELGAFELDPAAEAADESAAPVLQFQRANAVLLVGNAYPFWMLFQIGDSPEAIAISNIDIRIEDESIARLDADGNILALARGKTPIRAALTDGSSAEGVISVVDMGNIGVTYIGEMPRRLYDGSAAFALDPADFQLDADALAAGIAIQDILAVADGADVGAHQLSIEVTLSGEDASLQIESLAVEAMIDPLPISSIPDFADPFEAQTYTYTGSPVCPAPGEIRFGGEALVEGTDYAVEYFDNTDAGSAVARISGLGRFTGSFDHAFEILPADIDMPEIRAQLSALIGSEHALEDGPVCPALALSFHGAALTEARDYTVSFRNNDMPGIATMTIEGAGNFGGQIEIPFYVLSEDIASNAAVPATLELGVGETFSLSGAAFASSNKKIASVSASGLVKGVKKGKAIIAVKSSGGQIARCAVTVKAAPKKAALSASKLTLAIGQTHTLKAKLSPSGCRASAAWASSDESVAMVVNGQLTALKAGKATIILRTYNNKSAKCTVTVVGIPESIALNYAEVGLTVKGTLTLKATVSPAGALSTVRYTSSNAAVASVNASGKITAKKAGTATITAETVNGKKAACVVTVAKAPGKVTLSQSTATLGVGMTLQLTATTDTGANQAVAWSTSNKKIATVSASGLVKAKKVGKVTITAKVNGKKATCKIIVKALPKKVTVKAARTTLTVGQTTKATATLTKNSYSPIEWSVEGDAVTVDQSGNITAVRAGTATVLATATAAYIAGSVKITVTGGDEDSDSSQTAPSTGKKQIIDISKWQGSINFDKVKPNVSLVICRATCSMNADVMFATYAKAMNARNIPFGVYCYSHATDATTARAEARYLYSVAKQFGPKFYVLDAEEASLNQEAIAAFVAELRSLGVKKVGAYVAHNRYSSYGYAAIRDRYDFTWIPRYGKNTGNINDSTLPAYPCDLWQYSCNGSVPGISGPVDVNIITGQGKSLSWFVS